VGLFLWSDVSASELAIFMPFYLVAAAMGILASVSALRNARVWLKHATVAACFYCVVQLSWFIYWAVRFGNLENEGAVNVFLRHSEMLGMNWLYRIETFGLLNGLAGIYADVMMLCIQMFFVFYGISMLMSKRDTKANVATH